MIVNRIIPFSSVDGPGNRTAVFLQGCNINCKYCHNPETRALCMGCGLCVENCPAQALERTSGGTILYHQEKCLQCDTCIHICPHDSSPRTENLTPEETYERVKKQIPFIRGITVSGGECMLYPEFLTRLFTLAKKDRLNTMIDTNGTISFRKQQALLEVTDGVMLDIKAFADADHRNVTGHGNALVLDNAIFLSEVNKLFEVRAVIAPDLYDTKSSICEMGKFLQPLYAAHPFRIKVIAYRPMGVRKEYAAMAVPSADYLKYLADILQNMGFKDIIII